MKAVMDTLKAYSALTSLLGSADNIVTGHISQENAFPCVTLIQNNEPTKKRTGYIAYQKVRDQYPILQIDCWSKKSEQETYEIADLLDIHLIGDNVSGTRSWEKVTDSDQFEKDVHIFHKALRYSYEYTITDA